PRPGHQNRSKSKTLLLQMAAVREPPFAPAAFERLTFLRWVREAGERREPCTCPRQAESYCTRNRVRTTAKRLQASTRCLRKCGVHWRQRLQPGPCGRDMVDGNRR